MGLAHPRLAVVVVAAALLAVLAVAGIAARAAEVSGSVGLVGLVQQQVIAPGRQLHGELSRACESSNQDALARALARTDPLSDKAWGIALQARENWYKTGAPAAFDAYASAVQGSLAADALSMVPRTGEADYLVLVDKLLAASETAAREAKASEAAEVRAPAAPSAARVDPLPPPPAPSSDTVYVTSTGRKYHRSGCRYLSKGATAIDRSEAIAQGYTPCSACNP